jgi:predicted phage tail protein
MGIIMGVLMIAAIFLLPAAGVALAAGTAQMLAIGGAFAIIGGIITMATTNTPKVGNYDNQSVDKKKSFIYNGPVNVMEQGGAVPLVYGRHLCGSTVISSSIDVEQRL